MDLSNNKQSENDLIYVSLRIQIHTHNIHCIIQFDASCKTLDTHCINTAPEIMIKLEENEKKWKMQKKNELGSEH